MTSRPKFLHLRHASLLAALFLTLTFALWSDDTTTPPAPPSTGPVIMPPISAPVIAPAVTTPDATAPSATPGKVLPATGGNL